MTPCFAWFVWHAGHVGPPTLAFVDWHDAEPPPAAAPSLYAISDVSDPSYSSEEQRR